MEGHLERTISWYSRADESLVGEAGIDPVELAWLRGLFGAADDDPMVEVYPVGPAQAAALQRFLPEPIDLQRYDYLVECHAGPGEFAAAPEAARATTARH